MIKETTGKFKEIFVPYRQLKFEKYQDCYDVYKYAKRKSNYVQLSQVKDYKQESYDKKYPKTIMRHRWVYWNETGIKPDSSVIIHHINHVKGDDRPENLHVMNRSSHMKEHLRKSAIEFNGRKKWSKY